MSEITTIIEREELQFLRIHLEPSSPIEVEELTKALDGLARQYNQYIDKHPTFGPATDAKLYVSSISPGSIDIALLPDLASVAGLLKSAFEPITLMIEFAKYIKEFIGSFSSTEPPERKTVTIEDCDDAINIAAPIANHGGSQTVSIVN